VVIVFIYLWCYFSILYSGLWNLTSGIRELSLAKEGNRFLLFLQNVSREEKEGGALQVQI
jgi:hypothetical protein